MRYVPGGTYTYAGRVVTVFPALDQAVLVSVSLSPRRNAFQLTLDGLVERPRRIFLPRLVGAVVEHRSVVLVRRVGAVSGGPVVLDFGTPPRFGWCGGGPWAFVSRNKMLTCHCVGD